MEEKELKYSAGKKVNWCSPMETVSRFPKKLRIELPYGPEVALLDIYLKNLKTQRYMHPYVHCSIIQNSQTWKQFKCPLGDY